MLVVIDGAELAKNTKDAIASSMRNDKAMWQMFQEKKAQDELAKEAEKLIADKSAI